MAQFKMGVGSQAKLNVDASVGTALSTKSMRAIKVTLDSSGETMVVGNQVAVGPSLSSDFPLVVAMLEPDAPCIVLVRLMVAGQECEVPNCSGEDEIMMLAWAPDTAPIKMRMLFASARKSLKDECKDFNFREYAATETEEITLDAYVESTKTLTADDRWQLMSNEERSFEDAKRASIAEQAGAPRMLAGMAKLHVKVQESFNDAMKVMMGGEGKGVLAKLGVECSTLEGEPADGIGTPATFKGKVPAEGTAYAILRPGDGRILLVSWCPEATPVKQKMKFASFKPSVIDAIKLAAGDGYTVETADANEDADLEDTMPIPPSEEIAAALASAKKPVGPPGGLALPVLGGGGAHRPPGGVRMPGM